MSAATLVAPATPAAPEPDSTSQALLRYAGTLQIEALPDEPAAQATLHAAQSLVAAANAPATQCNLALGARRYASLFRSLALANESAGDVRTAAAMMARAIECAPRDVSFYSFYASELLALRRYEEAQQVIARGLAVLPTDFELRSDLLRLQFLQQHWDAVIEIATGLVNDDMDGSHWIYWQLLQYVAEVRSAKAHGARPARKLDAQWPTPIWQLLTGVLSQPELVRQLKSEHPKLNDHDQQLRQRLCEVLFYQGEILLARGDTAGARQHFAMATRMKILNFVEHDLALAELAKLRAAAKSGANLPRATHHIFVAR